MSPVSFPYRSCIVYSYLPDQFNLLFYKSTQLDIFVILNKYFSCNLLEQETLYSASDWQFITSGVLTNKNVCYVRQCAVKLVPF